MQQNRVVFCEDAIGWLTDHQVSPRASMVASLPDFSEFPNFSLSEWKEWFMQTAGLVLSRCSPEGVTVFYQSDIKVYGCWVDKSYLCQKAAEAQGHELLWHKIICRSPAGIPTFGRPSYSHILCFSQSTRVDISKSTADVIPVIGEKTWQRGMGLEACLMISKFIASEVKSHTIINPFCGEGSMLAAANAFGLEAVGVERSPKRAQKARELRISADLKNWD